MRRLGLSAFLTLFSALGRERLSELLKGFMTPRKKMRFANSLMVGGITPWIAMMGWAIAILQLNVQGKSPRVFMLDPIGMIGLMILVYVGSLVFSGIGFWWSLSLTNVHPEFRSWSVTALRATVAVVMGFPLLLIAFPNVSGTI